MKSVKENGKEAFFRDKKMIEVHQLLPNLRLSILPYCYLLSLRGWQDFYHKKHLKCVPLLCDTGCGNRTIFFHMEVDQHNYRSSVCKSHEIDIRKDMDLILYSFISNFQKIDLGDGRCGRSSLCLGSAWL